MRLVEGLDLEALVVVVDVDRQQATDVGPVDGAAARNGRAGARRCTSSRPSSQPPTESTKPSSAGSALLAEQVDLVAEPHERLGQLGVVDVRAGAAQQVAVEDQQLAQGADRKDYGDRRAALAIVARRMGGRTDIACVRPPPGARPCHRSTASEDGRRRCRLLRPASPASGWTSWPSCVPDSATSSRASPARRRICGSALTASELVGRDLSECPYCRRRLPALGSAPELSSCAGTRYSRIAAIVTGLLVGVVIASSGATAAAGRRPSRCPS